MGRFKDDFIKMSKGIGMKKAVEFVLIPRLLSRIGLRACSCESKISDRFINRNLKNIAEKYVNVPITDASDCIPNIIWVFWWQGKNSMPPVVRECYNSMLHNSNGREVRLLTQTNYQDYVKLPTHILDKFNEGKISFPHFSDIIRTYLLKEYGGLWIDAAVYVVKSIPLYKTRFYSPKVSEEYHDSPHLHKWVMSVMAAPPSTPMFDYLYEMLIKYWEVYDTDFNYLMYDYFIRYGYEHFAWLKELIDSRPIDSPDFFSTRYKFCEEVDTHEMSAILSKNTFISLTYRINYPMQYANGNYSYYAILIKKNLVNFSDDISKL